MATTIGGNNGDINLTLMRAEGERDRQSSSSNAARDMMESFSPEKILGGLAEVFKALGAISG